MQITALCAGSSPIPLWLYSSGVGTNFSNGLQHGEFLLSLGSAQFSAIRPG